MPRRKPVQAPIPSGAGQSLAPQGSLGRRGRCSENWADGLPWRRAGQPSALLIPGNPGIPVRGPPGRRRPGRARSVPVIMGTGLARLAESLSPLCNRASFPCPLSRGMIRTYYRGTAVISPESAKPFGAPLHPFVIRGKSAGPRTRARRARPRRSRPRLRVSRDGRVLVADLGRAGPPARERAPARAMTPGLEPITAALRRGGQFLALFLYRPGWGGRRRANRVGLTGRRRSAGTCWFPPGRRVAGWRGGTRGGRWPAMH